MRSWSNSLHSSRIFPPEMRQIVMPRPLSFFPVAGSPFPSPVFVPSPLQRTVTYSPSTSILSTCVFKSGNAVLHPLAWSTFNPMSRVTPWLTKSVA